MSGTITTSPARQTDPYSGLPKLERRRGNGIDHAYRDTGNTGDVPLVLLQPFRGNLANWDPALIDALAVHRRVLAFDNAGWARRVDPRRTHAPRTREKREGTPRAPRASKGARRSLGPPPVRVASP